jgi:type II restriction/modification system DNA methylase subunit YeeA
LKPDIADLLEAAKLDWSDIDPSILGTLFERGLDPDKRSQLGAHYTDREKIMMIVNPVIVEPLKAEWAVVKAKITDLLDNAPKATKEKLLKGTELTAATKAKAAAEALHKNFLDKLKAFRVLDPACGSGNFLYLSLIELKNIEHRVNLEAESLGLTRGFPAVGPECVLGIELNAYAAELARVSVWIGEIQWMRRNGFEASRNPILRSLNTIENRDAVLNADGTRAEWPKADVVVGNPPFLGASKILGELGDSYTATLRKTWESDVPGFADLVCYWFAKARIQIEQGKLIRSGLVATNSIRGGANREVLKDIVDSKRIFEAWSDEPWTVDGAAVRVSLICFDNAKSGGGKLNGKMQLRILSDLTSNEVGFDLTLSASISENVGVGCYGSQQKGSFDIPARKAREILPMPNPHGLPNSMVIKRSVNARQVTQGLTDSWVVDFGLNMPEVDAALFEQPFEIIQKQVLPERKARRDVGQSKRWWLHARPSPVYRAAIIRFKRYIVTPAVAKHRLFVWLTPKELADHALVVFARDDDTTFGILHSTFHELWSLRMGTFLGVGNDPRYTPSTTFETFPFPQGLTPNIPAADYAADPRAIKIAAAAARLNELRENWLNPADLVKRVPEVVAGYPDRLLPINEAAEATLKTRTLTKLYNARPAWLDNAHKALDEAVAEAYSWGDDWRAGKLNEDEILSRLFKLNQERIKK